jgi:hypothetical protein
VAEDVVCGAINLESSTLFRQYAGNDGCIVVAKLGDVLGALKPETGTTTPEARVILWHEELAGLQPCFQGPRDLEYTGWPLIYQRRDPYTEEREIRFVLKNQDGTYLKIPASTDCEVKKRLQQQHFAWPTLKGTLFAYEADLPFYRERIEERHLKLSVEPLKGALWGRLPCE